MSLKPLASLRLVLDIASAHVRTRARQTLVAVLGVATGVGFSIMMASIMEGSQDDFVRMLIDALPHVAVSDEQRRPPPQPAERSYGAAEIHGLVPEEKREGIKNPRAIVAALEAWVPGKVAPSVQAQAILRYAGRDRPVTVTGIDPDREPSVSSLPEDMREGTVKSLYTAVNAVILGSGLAAKLGAKVGSTLSATTTENVQINVNVVGISHSGIRSQDDGTVYVLIKTAQILAAQNGLVNEIRIRLTDAMSARAIAQRIEAQTGYKSVSWDEAYEDLMSSFQIRNIIMMTVVGAILLVASFGTYNIISTITHEKARDIAILKSLGFREGTVQSIFVLEGLLIGCIGAVLGFVLGYFMTMALGQVEIKSPFADASHLPVLYTWRHYAMAGAVALASSLIAGYFPARKAARVHPVEIIRGAT